MPTLPFLKMQAQGNDFAILDGRTFALPELSAAFIRQVAERRYGIGCDQVLALLPDGDTDVRLRIFNNDGTEAENCGNGLRCVGHVLLEEKQQAAVDITLNDRTVRAEKSKRGVRVHMGVANITARTEGHVDVEMGNLHSVFFAATENFPKNRNVEVVSGRIEDNVYIDVIERGSGHTPACGSGACAVAAAIWHLEDHTRTQTIHMPGGEVWVSGSTNDLILEGPVALVFSGKYKLDD
ncbi:MAG: diaminopimelate epimerase [Mariprofundaceae bacterium]